MDTKEQTKNRVGDTRYRAVVDAETLQQHAEAYEGWCVGCGTWAEQCEPDARKYKCGGCGQLTVYGVEEALLRGFVRVVGPATAEAGR